MTKFKDALMLSLLATGTALSTPATAAILVDTGQPRSGSNYSMANGTLLAGLFTLNAGTTVTSVEGFIGGMTDANGKISIYTGGVDPKFSGLLFSANYTIASAFTGAWRGVFGQSWNLAAGQYWVVFESDGANQMFIDAPNPLAQYAVLSPQGPDWIQLGSRASMGVRITDNAAVPPPTPGAVPEPGTWAMMLLGFGVVGGALRARRRVSVSYG